MPRYTPLKEDVGIVPTSILDPWQSADLRRRDDTLRRAVGGNGVVEGRGRYEGNNKERGIASPVVAEILLKLYGPPVGGTVLDPFSGSGAWALAATINGFQYYGIEIRPDVAEGARRIVTSACNITPTIVTGDACDPEAYPTAPYDAILTCPPYGDLEKYRGGPKDLSSLPYEDFLIAIHLVLCHTLSHVYAGSFAVWVVGNWIDGDQYVDFRGDLIRLARATGWLLHDDVVLVGKLGTAGQRVGNSWQRKRLVRRHEYAVVLKAPE